MRRWVIAGALLLFLAWFTLRAVPFLGRGRPAVWATPTSEAYNRADIIPVTVPGKGRICATRMPWGPQARHIEVRVLPAAGASAGAIGFEARGPGGYRATGEVAAGLPRDGRAIAAIAPAPRELEGTLCVTNRDARPLAFYGVQRNGRYAAPSDMTVDGRAITDRQLSILLLSNPHQSIVARLGDVLSHAAAFRPLSAWMVWIVFALLLAGTPVALAVAIARAADEDDDAQPDSARE